MRFKPTLALAGLILFAVSPAAANDAPATETEKLPTAFVAGWKGERVCEVLEENEYLRSARCVFPPGGGHDRHSHPPHWGYIVKGGTMRITTASGTVERVLKTGDTWWSYGIEWHEAVNIGSETAIYMIVEPKTGTK
jgi:beta-alanine degradation protein BauB